MSVNGLLGAIFSSKRTLYRSVKNIFGFYPGNIFIYELALRHKSATTEKINGLKINNERLEFLGDAVLNLVVADFLFRRFPYENEGFLTEMRSKIVSRSSLNKLALKMGIQNLIISAAGQSSQPKSAGGDAIEAILGAVYVDKGYRFAHQTIIERIINLHFDIEQLVDTEISFKSKMIEWSQKEKCKLEFSVLEEVGDGYQKQYVVEILVDSMVVAKAQDYSIKGAENLAAEKAWLSISI